MSAIFALWSLLWLLSTVLCNSWRPSIHKGDVLKQHHLGPPHRLKTINAYFQASLHPRSCFSSTNASNDPTIYVTDFGADPTATADSTSAFQQAIQEALTRGAPNGMYLSNNITDLGGVTIDLQGGDYLISAPLVIPPMYGNLRFISGTIRAADDFQPTKTGYLLSFGAESFDCPSKNSQKSCNENIAVQNVMFDCRQICAGALQIIDTMGAVIGPQIFVLGFINAGITVVRGHETMIFNAWLGQYLYSDHRKNTATATAIQLFGNDHYVTDSVMFAGRIGVHITHAANVLEGIHTWNLATNSNGTGILVESQSVRLMSCYLDYNDLVLVAPIRMLSAEDTFFLGGGTVLLRANAANAKVESLSLLDSQYSLGNHPAGVATIALDESAGKFTTANDIVVGAVQIYNDNGYIYKSTKLTRSLTQSNANQFLFDFTDALVFDSIDIRVMQYTLEMDSTNSNMFVQHAISRVAVGKVMVQTSAMVNATVYVTVDQSPPNF